MTDLERALKWWEEQTSYVVGYHDDDIFVKFPDGERDWSAETKNEAILIAWNHHMASTITTATADAIRNGDMDEAIEKFKPEITLARDWWARQAIYEIVVWSSVVFVRELSTSAEVFSVDIDSESEISRAVEDLKNDTYKHFHEDAQFIEKKPFDPELVKEQLHVNFTHDKTAHSDTIKPPICPLSNKPCSPDCAWFMETRCAVVEMLSFMFEPQEEPPIEDEEPTMEERARTL